MFLHGWKEEVVRIGRDTTAQERNEAEGRKAITVTGMESPQVGIVGRSLACSNGRKGRAKTGWHGQKQRGRGWTAAGWECVAHGESLGFAFALLDGRGTSAKEEGDLCLG